MSDRDEFEKWAKGELDYGLWVDSLDSYGCYRVKEIATAWQAWQAARAQGGEAEPVAWSLRWPEDEAVNAETTFRTEELARRYANRCLSRVTVVPLYTHPPRQQGGELEKGNGQNQ